MRPRSPRRLLDRLPGRRLLAPALVVVLVGGPVAGCGGETATPAAESSASSPEDTASSPDTTSPDTTSPDTTSPDTTSPDTTSPTPTPREEGEQRVVLTVRAFAYSGARRVSPGQRITVVNRDEVAHTVTARGGGDAFDVNVPAGARVQLRAPRRPGDYAFYCRYHSGMTGVLTVA